MTKRYFKKMLKPILTGELIFKHLRKQGNAKFPCVRSNNSNKFNVKGKRWRKNIHRHTDRNVNIRKIRKMYRQGCN